MKTRYFLPLLTITTIIVAVSISAFQANKGKWEVLFDGTSTAKWRGYQRDTLPSQWKIEDGALTLAEKKGGYIVTKKQYKNFELELDWKIAVGGNSGILFHVSEEPQYKVPYVTGPEMQIIDDEGNPDAKKKISHQSGANYDLIVVSKKTVKPAGQWNHIRLIVNNGHVEHWLNGEKVVDYQLGSPEWTALVKGSKFANMPGYGQFATGYISLQDHGSKVWFRNIRIKEL